MTLASFALGFCIRSQHSNPQSDEPSGRYQVLAGEVTPIEQWPSGEGAPSPVHIILRSTAIVLPSAHSTFVEKSVAPISSLGFMTVCESAGKTTPGLSTGPTFVW